MGCSPPSLLSPPQMPDYKHATLQEDEGPEPAGDGSASPDSVEVSYAPVPLFCLGPLSCSPSLQQEWGQEPGQPWLSLDDVLGGSQNAAKSVPLPCSSRGGGAPASTNGSSARDALVSVWLFPSLIPIWSPCPSAKPGHLGAVWGVDVISAPASCPGGVPEGDGAAAEPPGLTLPAGAGALHRRRHAGSAARHHHCGSGHPVQQR